MIICQICKKELKNYKALWSHLYHNHTEYSLNSGQKYYDEFISQTKEHKCQICNENLEFISLTYGYTKTCSKLSGKKCSDILNGLNRCGRFKGRPSSFKGKKHKVESREKASKSHKRFYKTNKGKQLKTFLSNSLKGKNNPYYRMSEEAKKEMYKKISQTMKQHIHDGTFTPCVTNSWANSKCKLLYIENYEKYYRSSWDAAFQILNPLCEYEKTRIYYYDIKNKQRNYIVDFTNEDKKILYEIKPNTEKTKQNNLNKTKAAIEWCNQNDYQYKIISNEYFKENAKNINFEKYDKKIYKGMKQFL